MEISALILRVLNNAASPEEAIHLRQWIAADHENALEYEAIHLLWQQSLVTTESITLDYQPIHNNIRQQRRRKKILIAVFIAVLFIAALITISQLNTATKPKEHRFEQASLSHIATMLKDQYHTQLQIVPSATHCHFTGIIFNDTPAEILRYITNNLNLTLTPTGKNTFVITGTCTPASSASRQKPIYAPTNKI
ncbi:MAG: hypothetical protein J0L67_03670 [Cytophagales bacterium]|nr:hypothetical protein [Cytophagales bacterium]